MFEFKLKEFHYLLVFSTSSSAIASNENILLIEIFDISITVFSKYEEYVIFTTDVTGLQGI